MKKYNLIIICIFYLAFSSCQENATTNNTLNIPPPIFPDYSETTVPANIAPLHFKLIDEKECSKAIAIFQRGNYKVEVKAKNGQFMISKSDWKKLTQNPDEKGIEVIISAKTKSQWQTYKPFNIYVSADHIDPYIAYRLIDPGYEIWNEMGIYQRCIENYKENAIITNNGTNYNCMNCHSFCMQNPDKMLFHMRSDHGGTYVINEGNVEKLNTKTDKTISALVYPSWHPSGKYVAFSVNDTKQVFHTTDKNRVEVFDYKSDVVVYDIDKHEIITTPLIFSKSSFETFPTFSPDGKTLYFCTADSVTMPKEYNKVKYNLCAISFDETTRKFGEKIDTLVNVNETGKSVSFPRVSPDGKFLVFTMSNYGNFSIWHKDADLYIINLGNNEYKPLETLNSDDVESYHSWSSNSRWLVFSSRRIDGLYTRPFFAHIDENGNASKPFLLPQKDINSYERLMKSYNIPEFVKGKVRKSGYEITKKARNDKGIDISFAKQRQ